MKCRKCGHINPNGAVECEACAVIFKDIRRDPVQTGPTVCSWNDHGRACPSRGIITVGAGWYCREHWDRLHGRKPEGTGNYVAKPVPRTVYAQRWDGWYEKWLVERDRKRRMPDLSDLVGEEAGQA